MRDVEKTKITKGYKGKNVVEGHDLARVGGILLIE